MDLSTLQQQITWAEGCRVQLYDDATGKPISPGQALVGNPTGGIGHNFFRPLSGEVIALLFEEDVAACCADLDHALPWWRSLDEVRQRVLIDLTFNMGIGTLLTFKRFISALYKADYQAAAAEVIDSKIPPRRAAMQADMLRSGSDAYWQTHR